MLSAPKLVGILNITPDSFSGDGLLDLEKLHGMSELQACFQAGADYIDIGAEATSPGSTPISADVEQERLSALIDAFHELSVHDRRRLMCDTRHAQTAQWVAKAGFGCINDVSGGRADPKMLPFIAESGLQYVMMYAKNDSGRADLLDNQQNIFQKLCDFFDEQINVALSFGVQRKQLILDPGMGAFISVHPEDSLEIIARLPELKARYQQPLFVGVSRKGFLAKLSPFARNASQRLGASLALAAEAAARGADYLRVHDVRDTRQFFDVQRAIHETARKL